MNNETGTTSVVEVTVVGFHDYYDSGPELFHLAASEYGTAEDEEIGRCRCGGEDGNPARPAVGRWYSGWRGQPHDNKLGRVVISYPTISRKSHLNDGEQPVRQYGKNCYDGKKYPKILIAEDDIGFRRLLVKFIQKAWPCQIMEAEDGVEVLQIILKEAPDLDLVILDISLPYVDGLQVLQIIRSNQRLEHLPIIACTAHGSEEDVARILQHGVNDFILKPSSKATILEKVARMLGMPEN